MYRRFFAPHDVHLPESIEEHLECACASSPSSSAPLRARCLAFNRRGTILAAGCQEGAVVLWDFETRGVAAVLGGVGVGVGAVSGAGGVDRGDGPGAPVVPGEEQQPHDMEVEEMEEEDEEAEPVQQEQQKAPPGRARRSGVGGGRATAAAAGPSAAAADALAAALAPGPVASVSWSRDGRYLAAGHEPSAAGSPGVVVLWDVLAERRACVWAAAAAPAAAAAASAAPAAPPTLASVELSPRPPYRLLVNFAAPATASAAAARPPVLMDVPESATAPGAAAGGTATATLAPEAAVPLPPVALAAPGGAEGGAAAASAAAAAGASLTTACFSHDARCVFAAPACGGAVAVLVDAPGEGGQQQRQWRVLDVARLPAGGKGGGGGGSSSGGGVGGGGGIGGPRVASLRLNRRGTILLALCRDRTVRMLSVLAPEVAADARCAAEAGEEEQQGQQGPRRWWPLADLPAAAAGAAKADASFLRRRPTATAADDQGEDDGGQTPANPAPPAPTLLCALAGGPAPFSNPVDRTAWRAAAASADGEHVAAAAAPPPGAAAHLIYVWGAAFGRLLRVLEGPRGEGAADVAWHPMHPSLVVSASSPSGRVYVWARRLDENWDAFAPDFEVLEENQEYVEAEDEFDLNRRPPQTAGAGGGGGSGPAGGGGGNGEGEGDPEDEAVDVLGRADDAHARIFTSDDEDDVAAGVGLGGQSDRGPVYYLPAHLPRAAAGLGGGGAAAPGGGTAAAGADGGAGGGDVGGGGAADADADAAARVEEERRRHRALWEKQQQVAGGGGGAGMAAAVGGGGVGRRGRK